jgi:uncharacterized membrane protein
MSINLEERGAGQTSAGLVTWTNVIYALHALAVLIGVTSAVTIVGTFVFGLPSIVAVIMTYLRRSDARGTWLESHYRWLLNTFWGAVIGGLLAGAATFFLLITIIGIVLAWIPLLVVGLWLSYRVIRGWLALRDRRPVA